MSSARALKHAVFSYVCCQMTALPAWENPERLGLAHISSLPVSPVGLAVSLNHRLILCKYTGPPVSSPEFAYKWVSLIWIIKSERTPSNSILWESWELVQNRMHFLSRGQPAKSDQLPGLWVHRRSLLLDLVLNPNFRTGCNKLKSQVQIYPLCTKVSTPLQTWAQSKKEQHI